MFKKLRNNELFINIFRIFSFSCHSKIYIKSNWKSEMILSNNVRSTRENEVEVVDEQNELMVLSYFIQSTTTRVLFSLVFR
jgi:hypothetical protein